MAEVSTFIKLDRNITRWRWYQNANTFRVFVHCLIAANIKDQDFEKITVHRGELVTSYGKLAASLGLSLQNVRTAVEHLRDTGELTIKRYPKFLVLTIQNYDRYQGNQQTANMQLTGNSQATHNNQRMKKKEMNDKNYPPTPRGGGESRLSSFSTQEFFEAAVARSLGTDYPL